jgi:hypothetical protein
LAPDRCPSVVLAPAQFRLKQAGFNQASFNYVRRCQPVSSRSPHRSPVAAVPRTLVLLAVAALALPVAAQYPGKVSSSGNAPVLRAVSVYEWTGDEQHPQASRLIPITVFDGQQLQDGGIYLASPAPLSLQTDVEYQLKQDGRNTGLFVVEDAALILGSWVGHGSVKELPKPKPIQPAAWKDDEDDVASDEPVLHRKHHLDDQSGSGSSTSGSGGQSSQGPPSDPDRPTLHRSDDSGTSANAPAPDPDRPTLSNSTDTPAPGNPTTVDPNHPNAQPKNSQTKNGEDDSYVTSMASDSDPSRPRLVRGKSNESVPSVMPSFVGLPADMEQAVAVSDPRTIPEHIFSYSWANPADEAKYKADLEVLARTALGLTPPPAKPASKRTAASHKTQLAPPPAPLFGEQFRVFELAYSSGATLVLSAHTAGTGADEKFVTLIAQPDLYGNLAVLMKNVTDDADLDQTPRMRLIDAVDAMNDNRGELLFELRGATERQFALYRVLRGQATQIFVSGSRQFGSVSN